MLKELFSIVPRDEEGLALMTKVAINDYLDSISCNFSSSDSTCIKFLEVSFKESVLSSDDGEEFF